MSTYQRNNVREMSYEFSLIRDELAAVDPLAAMHVDAAFNQLSHSIDADADESDEELMFWPRQFVRRRRGAAEIDSTEGYRADNDSEPDSSANIHGRRARSRFAAAEQLRETETSRSVHSDSMDAIRDTSLVEPELVLSSPPVSRAELHQAEIREGEHAERLIEMDMHAEAARAAWRQRRLVARTDAAEDSLIAHRRSGERERLTEELNRRRQQFSVDDPPAYAQWHEFCGLATRCSTSVARRLQIMQWYTRRPRGGPGGPVPRRLSRQLRRLELWYTYEARLERRFHTAEMQDGSRPGVDVHQWMAEDDNVWSANSRRWTFGYELGLQENGFTDYQPRGEGPALLIHLEANLQARVMRLYHANPDDIGELTERMRYFCARAVRVLADHRTALMEDGPETTANLQRIDWLLDRYRITMFQAQGGNGGARDEGEESDASSVDQIRTGIPASWRLRTAGH